MSDEQLNRGCLCIEKLKDERQDNYKQLFSLGISVSLFFIIVVDKPWGGGGMCVRERLAIV